MFTNSIRSAKTKGTVELHFKNTQCWPHSPCIEVIGSFTGGSQGSRIGSALCSYEDHVHDRLRILSIKSVDSFPLTVVCIGLNPTIATKDFEKQDDYLALNFSMSFRHIVSCLSLIYQAPTTTYVLVAARSNLIIWANNLAN